MEDHRLYAAPVAGGPREAVDGGDREVDVRGIERRGGQRGERERAGDRRERDAAPLRSARAAGAACGFDEVVAEPGEIGREPHALYMGSAPRLCQGAPPQAGGTFTGNLRVSEPSPGRPLILQ